MVTEKYKVENEKVLAEKCRKALEKTLGMPVPMPNSLSKRHRFFGR